MPEELLLLVLSYLKTKTLLSLQEVSVNINRLSKDKTLWNNYKCFMYSHNNYEEFISEYQDQYLEVRSYNFTDRKIKFLLKTLQPPNKYSHWSGCCIEDHFYCMFFTYKPPYRVVYKDKKFTLVKQTYKNLDVSSSSD